MSEESHPKRDQFYHYSETVRNVDVRSERAYVRMIKKRYITSLIGATIPIYLLPVPSSTDSCRLLYMYMYPLPPSYGRTLTL